MVSLFKTVELDYKARKLVILADGDWRGFRSRACQKEPETAEWIAHFNDGAVLWDIGASVGSYSLIAAASGHHVVAFEPFAPSYGHLQTNSWLNSLESLISCSPVALSNQTGVHRMYVSSMQPGAASHRTDNRGDGRWQFVHTMTVDAAAGLFPQPTHVKIDVDGAELAVVEGGRKVWPGVKSLLVESQPGTVEDIEVILAAAGLHRAAAHRRMGETKQHNYLFQRTE